MPQGEYFTLVIVGGVFFVIGGLMVLLNWREEKHYYEMLAHRRGDVREFMEHWPSRQQLGSIKVGGWIALALGVGLATTAFIVG
ncbi:hypothetical protein ACFLYV_05520 [Chloroflexota bacterium]